MFPFLLTLLMVSSTNDKMGPFYECLLMSPGELMVTYSLWPYVGVPPPPGSCAHFLPHSCVLTSMGGFLSGNPVYSPPWVGARLTYTLTSVQAFPTAVSFPLLVFLFVPTLCPRGL